MNNKFYQACFTRVDGRGAASGWQTVCTSPDADTKLIQFFESTEKSNEVIGEQPKDSNGTAKCMMEISCNEKYLGLTYVQYGLSDNTGRATFFSHGYLFEDAYELLKTPERFLGISRTNYHFSIEETKNIPNTLIIDSFDVEESILSKYGISRDNYLALMKCIYYPLLSSIHTTVHVITDGTDEMAKDLLFLIYNALPFSLRTRITAVTYAKPQSVNSILVFSDARPSYGSYINPYTGENNILTSDFCAKLDRYPNAMFYPLHMPYKYKDNYYLYIESILTAMGNCKQQNMDMLRLAYLTLFRGRISNDDLVSTLYDWLTLPINTNERTDKLVNDILKLIVDKHIMLSEEHIRLLSKRAAESSIPEFRSAALKYEALTIAQQDSYKATELLRSYHNNTAFFQELIQMLRSYDPHNKIVERFYDSEVQRIMSDPHASYSDMISLLKECSAMPELLPSIRKEFTIKAFDIAKAERNRGVSFVTSCENLHRAMQQIDPNTKVDIRILKDEYDTQFVENLDISKLDEYGTFYKEFSSEFPESFRFYKAVVAAVNHDYDELSEYFEYNNRAPKNIYSKYSKHKYNKKITDIALSYNASEYCMSIVCWIAFATAVGNSLPISFMVKNEASLLLNAENFEKSLQNDPFWDDFQNLSKDLRAMVKAQEKKGVSLKAPSKKTTVKSKSENLIADEKPRQAGGFFEKLIRPKKDENFISPIMPDKKGAEDKNSQKNSSKSKKKKGK